MSTAGVTGVSPQGGSPKPPAPRDRRLLVRRLVALLVAAVAVGLGWVLSAPTHEFRAGYGMELERSTGTRIWAVLEHSQNQEPGVLSIHNIEPELTRDGAGVKVEYVVCHHDPGAMQAGTTSVGYGMRDSHVLRVCDRLVPAAGASFELGAVPGQELLVGVTTTRPGRSVVRSHRIEFSQGWRHGSDVIHVEVIVAAR